MSGSEAIRKMCRDFKLRFFLIQANNFQESCVFQEHCNKAMMKGT